MKHGLDVLIALMHKHLLLHLGEGNMSLKWSGGDFTVADECYHVKHLAGHDEPCPTRDRGRAGGHYVIHG